MSEKKSHSLSSRVILSSNLDTMQKDLIFLGQNTAQCIALAHASVQVPNDYLLEQSINIKNNIHDISTKAEKQAFVTLTLQQPMIKDLRFVLGFLKIVTKFDDITSYCKEIIEISTNIHNTEYISSDLYLLSENLELLFQDVLSTFQTTSTELIEKLIKKAQDNQLLIDKVKQEAINKLILPQQDNIYIDDLSKILSITSLEDKIKEKILSILYEVYFIHTGEKYIK